MRALDAKLFRDLRRLKGQVLAVALVIASGVAVLVMSLTAMVSLDETAKAYYERYRFADVFADLKRAPERLARRIAMIPGVQTVETRIQKLAILDVADFPEPVVGLLSSIPERGEPMLNRLVLREGRSVAPGRPDEAVIGEPFAEAHGLGLGDRVGAIINGRKRALRIVGIALSPEHVYAIGPGALVPDNRRYGVLWMGREALAAAYDLDGAFNAVSLLLLRSARAEEVIDRLDRLLAPYGGTGAYARRDQVSNWFLMNEITQLKNIAGILPTIFLVVAAVLTNMVLSRLIAVERGEIGLLKAFGYGDLEVGWHYVKLVVVIAGIGILLGWAVGFWLGQVTTRLYTAFFRFPFLYYRPAGGAFAIAALVSLGAALAGTATAVRRAVRLPPAEAMRPPAPPMFRRGGLADTRLALWPDQPTRMVLRQILRWPLRSLLTAAGVAMAVAVLVTALQWRDAVNHMVEVFFVRAQHQDMTIGLVEPRSSAALAELRRLPGVLAAEPERVVRARIRAGARMRREPIRGVPPDARLSLIQDSGGRTLTVPPKGLVLSAKLAEILDVGPGDEVTVEVLEGRRPVLRVPVADVFDTYIGTPAYMDIRALDRLMRERPVITGAHLLVDPRREEALLAALKDIPRISAVTLRRAAIAAFHETMGETVLIYISFFVVFASALAFGVVFNSARIALSERGRELATLRVLGFSRFEVSYILLGEVGLLVFLALPPGLLAGYGLAWLIASNWDTELFRVPLHVEPASYGLAVLIGLAAAVVSAVLARRRLDRLDIVAVLKTRD